MDSAFKKNDFSTRKNFVIKEKSLSNLQSRKGSISVLKNSSKQKFALTYRQPSRDQDTQTEKKTDQIALLKKKLDVAMNFAINQKKISSSNRQQVFKDQKTKAWYENKIHQLQKMVLDERQMFKNMRKQKRTIENKFEETFILLQQKKRQIQVLNQKNQQTQRLQAQITRLNLIIRDIQPLKDRIKTLQGQIRKQKLTVKDNTKNLKVIEKQKDQLAEELRKQKPYQQQLKQHITYLERVNLDLNRKMQDFDRRENSYIRQANIAKANIKKLTQQKSQLQQKLFDTCKNLAAKNSQCEALKIQSDGKSVVIYTLQNQLKTQRERVSNLINELQETKDFYRQQQIENKQLTVKNKVLSQHQSQYQRVLAHFQQVNDEINLAIISRGQQIKKLHCLIEILQKHSNQLQEKFQKFQILFQDRTEKGDNQICQFYYQHIRQNVKLKVLNKQLKSQLDEKILRFGEERDTWTRKTNIRSVQTPNSQELFGYLYHQKNEQLILLQSSNDQLFKIKKQLQERLLQLQKQIQEEKKLSANLKLKAAEVFRAKKQVQDARKNMDRYQQMIQEQNETVKDLQSQLIVLRQKINFLNQKNFILDLDNKNHLIKIKQLQEIMVEINADVLIEKKTKNDKNAHLIHDSVDKLQNGIKSLQFFFSCSFCGQIPPNPTTVTPCGHTYCQKPKCKEAYSEFCYECDTGMPIQTSFSNKYLKQALTKFKFFKIVIDEATTNVKSLMKDI